MWLLEKGDNMFMFTKEHNQEANYSLLPRLCLFRYKHLLQPGLKSRAVSSMVCHASSHPEYLTSLFSHHMLGSRSSPTAAQLHLSIYLLLTHLQQDKTINSVLFRRLHLQKSALSKLFALLRFIQSQLNHLNPLTTYIILGSEQYFACA